MSETKLEKTNSLAAAGSEPTSSQRTSARKADAAKTGRAEPSESTAQAKKTRSITVASRIFLLVGALVLVAGAVWAFGPWRDDDPAKFNGDGTYRVPEDIEPGVYRTKGGPDCHWERLDGTGEDAKVLQEGRAPDSRVVGVHKGDKGFRSSGCGTWVQVHRPQ